MGRLMLQGSGDGVASDLIPDGAEGILPRWDGSGEEFHGSIGLAVPFL